MQLERSAVALTRSFMGGRPKRLVNVEMMETCSNWVLTVAPRRTVGPITSPGTRNPSWVKSGRWSTVVGGGTWS